MFRRLLLAGLAALSLGAYALDTQVIEGAKVTHDPAAGIVYAKGCEECPAVRLELTEETVIYIDGKPEKFVSQPHIGGLTDVGYNAERQVVLWFRPLFAR
ncbi:MAG: hypothetical protein AAF493_07100 [Pseudomonadota bacterium]